MAKQTAAAPEIKEVFSLEDFNNIGKVRDREKTITVAGLDGAKLKIRAITSEEHSAFVESATISEGGKTRVNHQEIAQNMIVAGIIAPNFSDAKFLDDKKCMTAKEYYLQYFPAGVIDSIWLEINKLSGFGIGMDDLVETAKN
jgi:hypothetical protein